VTFTAPAAQNDLNPGDEFNLIRWIYGWSDRRIGFQLYCNVDRLRGCGSPEPSTWAMMILGFVGVMAYRRKGGGLHIA
jgi:hypothetical protein